MAASKFTVIIEVDPDAQRLIEQVVSCACASDVEGLARAAYRAYGEHAQWKNVRGGGMPEWEALPHEIRMHWEAATEPVYYQALRDAIQMALTAKPCSVPDLTARMSRANLGPLPAAPAGTHEERAAERLRGSLRLHAGIDVTDILDVLDEHEFDDSVCPTCQSVGTHAPGCDFERVTAALRKLAPGWPKEGRSE